MVLNEQLKTRDMKAEELMRFDWVHLVDDNTPRQVDWIRSGEVGLFWNKTVTPPYLEPIPLTPEILEKNGFEKWDGWYIHSLENFGIEIAFAGTILKIGGECGTLELPAIIYVHQLQHALKLCRIKMEIEL